MYDYKEAMTEDVKEWIKENIDLTEWTEDREGLEQQLNDDLWTEDSITGNARLLQETQYQNRRDVH